MAAAAHIVENIDEKESDEIKELREQFLQQLDDEPFDKNYFEIIARLRNEYEYDRNSKAISGMLNEFEDARITKIIEAIKKFKVSLEDEVSKYKQKDKQKSTEQDEEVDLQISLQINTQEFHRVKRYIVDKKNEFRLLYSAKKKFNEGLANCPELSEFNININTDTEKPEDISLANFLSAKGVLTLFSDSFNNDNRNYSTGCCYHVSENGLATTLKQISVLLNTSNEVNPILNVTDKTNKKNQVLLRKLTICPGSQNDTLLLSYCPTEFNIFLNALQTTTTLTTLDLQHTSEEDCLTIISTLRNNSSIRTFYWPQPLCPFNKPRNLTDTKIKEKVIEFLDRSSASAISRVTTFNRVTLEGNEIALSNTLNSLGDSGLGRIEVTMDYQPPNPKSSSSSTSSASSSANEKHSAQEMAAQTAKQETATQDPVVQKTTHLQDTLISVKWKDKGSGFYSNTVITSLIQPFSTYTNITRLDLAGRFDVKNLLTILAPLPLQDLTLNANMPSLIPSSWDPLENWHSTLKSFSIFCGKRNHVVAGSIANNFCQNLKKLSMLNTLNISTDVFCDFVSKNDEQQKELFKIGSIHFLATINSMSLTALKLFDRYFGGMMHREVWEEGPAVIKMFASSLVKNRNLMDVSFFERSTFFSEMDNILDVIKVDDIKNQAEKNTLRTSRWVEIAPLIACIRAHRTSAIRFSIIPLLPRIQALAGFDTAKNNNNTTATTVKSTTANAAADAATNIPLMAFSNDASNLQTSRMTTIVASTAAAASAASSAAASTSIAADTFAADKSKAHSNKGPNL